VKSDEIQDTRILYAPACIGHAPGRPLRRAAHSGALTEESYRRTNALPKHVHAGSRKQLHPMDDSEFPSP